MLLTVYGLFILIYVLFNYLLFRGWRGWRLTKQVAENQNIKVNVVVAVRNEENHITELLTDLENQNYDVNNFEVLIVNDQSEDRTVEIAKNFSIGSKIKISVHDLENTGIAPKKEAITLGVRYAAGELILVTDADCRVGADWLSCMAKYFEDGNTKFAAGPVTMAEGTSFFKKMQAIEFASLIGSGAASMYFRRPVMCNGANLAFLKKTFFEVNGFDGNDQIASGDDVFLMRKIFNKYPDDVIFAKGKDAIVKTRPLNNVKSLINQRIRWAGKWKFVEGQVNKSLPLCIFSFHFFTLFLYIKLILNQILVAPFLSLILLKFISEYLFLSDVLKFLGNKRNIIVAFIVSMIYPVYAVFIGLVVNFTGYSWKGRKYKN